MNDSVYYIIEDLAAELVMSLVTAMKRLLFIQRFSATLFRQTFTWHDDSDL